VKIGSSICVAKNRKEDFQQMAYSEMIRAYNIRQALPVANKTALLVIDMQQYFDRVFLHP
jgi:isochorismate hydrolase